MYVFYYYIIRHYQICVCKIPDSLNTGFDQTVSDLRSLCLWNGKCCDLDIIFFDESFQIIHRTDLNAADHQSDQLWIDIKHSSDNKSSPLKIRIIGNGLSQITCTNDDHIVLTVNSKDLCDLWIKIFYVISVALLAKATKIVKVLTDLRRRYLHSAAQFIRRNTLYSFLDQLAKVAIISGQSWNYCFWYLFAFHFNPLLLVHDSPPCIIGVW